MIGIPSEHAEQVSMVNWLNRRGITFFAVPNGGKRNKVTAAILKAEGVQAGVPDLVILDRPPKAAHFVGVVVEMKRVKGGTVSASQREWLGHFERCGWARIVARGAEDGVIQLQALGF